MKHMQAAILFLLIANLATTAWFGLSKDSAPAPAPQVATRASAGTELPEFVTQSYRNDLLQNFITHFNSKNYDAMYAMLGPTARAQIPAEMARGEFQKLSSYFDMVKGGKYARAELAQRQGDTSVYVLTYDVNFSEKSQAGANGALKINLATNATGDYQVYGIRLNSM